MAADVKAYLQVTGLSKSFGDRVLFRDISFGLSQGQRVALVARNGTGKSTLLDILMSRQEADAGTVIYRRDIRVSYLRQLTDNTTAVEHRGAVAEHDEGWELRYTQYLTKLEIKGTHSGGEQKRMALAAVLADQPDLLILDEPTNHLDLAMVEWLENFLSRSTMTILMVTHDRYFLDRVCDTILELDDQTLYTYRGNYSYYLEKRAERIQVFNAETEKMRNLYRTELEWMRRMPQARGHKSRDRIDNFYRIEERVHLPVADKGFHLEPQDVYIGSKIFEAKGVNKAYPNRTILRDFNYVFARFEKMGIIGPNGAGKTTFIRMLLGEEMPDSGVFDIGTTVRFGYLSQLDRDKVAGEKLSGGERQRKAIEALLSTNPNFLVLDEPTNDLDIQTMAVLEDYLQQFQGCLIVVSHDRYFMDKVVDHLLVFAGDGSGAVKDYPGNYTQYRESREIRESREPREPSSSSNSSGAKPKTERPRRLSYKEQQEFAALEQELPKLEAERAELEVALSGALSDPAEIQAASARYQALQEEIDEKEMRWLELSELA